MKNWMRERGTTLASGFLILTFIAIVIAAAGVILGAIHNLYRPVEQIVGASLLVEMALIAILAFAIGIVTRTNLAKKVLWSIPVLSVFFKMAYYVKLIMNFPFVRVQQWDGQRILGVATSIQEVEKELESGATAIEPEINVCIPTFPIPMGVIWDWFEPRRVEYVKNSKREVLTLALSAGLSVRFANADNPRLRVKTLGGLTYDELERILNLPTDTALFQKPNADQ